MSKFISNPSISVVEKWTKTQILYRKVCGLTNMFESFKVFIVTKLILIVYSTARERAKKKSSRFISYIYSHALMYLACSCPIPIIFPKYLAMSLYLSVTPPFA